MLGGWFGGWFGLVWVGFVLARVHALICSTPPKGSVSVVATWLHLGGLVWGWFCLVCGWFSVVFLAKPIFRIMCIAAVLKQTLQMQCMPLDYIGTLRGRITKSQASDVENVKSKSKDRPSPV